jgi:pimeloyl-ACP methyl ester carboxylesterase
MAGQEDAGETQRAGSDAATTLETGSGSFFYYPAGERSPIEVFYHRPRSLTASSRVLLVIPGAGRNADSYRDAWVEASEAYSVLILSPRYPEADYDFGAYHMVGTMRNIDLRSAASYREQSNIVDLDETKLVYEAESRQERWILGDFDKIVARGRQLAKLENGSYDAFGHSAGGQILHRFALLLPNSNVDRILAANSGFYTLPTALAAMPFGLAGMGVGEQTLARSFSKKLTVLVGELDNAEETGGTLLRSASADRQGLHRRARGEYFHQAAEDRAREIGAAFNWELLIVDGVGHDHVGMADAAARILYVDQ